MPIESKAQQAAMYAAAAGKSTLGIPKSVGVDFVAAGPAGGSYAKLPEKAVQKKKTPGPRMQKAYHEGRISDRAMAKAGY
jgi:hypothetical protein